MLSQNSNDWVADDTDILRKCEAWDGNLNWSNLNKLYNN